jgi:photosystem II stability/assembly factor-like uncharacterized protein
MVESSFSRVFLMKNRANPLRAPIYEGLMRAGAMTLDQGKLTTIWIPDPENYGKYLVAGKIPGEPGLPQLSIDARYTTDLSDLLKMVNDGCDHDIQVHIGACKNPQDFNGGWSKVIVLEGARENSYATTDIGSLMPSQRTEVVETAKFEGQVLYELKPMEFSEKAATQINDEVVGVVFCDSPSCGTCGITSDGCSVIFAVTKSSGGSPGLLASVVFTTDGGSNWQNDPIDSLGASDSPTGLACVGGNLVVISDSGLALSWAPLADIIAGVETWQQMSLGFVAAKGPRAILSVTQSLTLIVGSGGYIYSSDDPTSSVNVLDAGNATVNNLNAVAAADLENFVAVGAANTVVFSTDGGANWETVTGPAVGIVLTSVEAISRTEWWVGGANGKLYFTNNSGLTWAEKAFPGSGSGSVGAIKFASPTVGYLAHATSTPKGRILRTINGGFSWYVLPEGKGTMPANNRINALAVCPDMNKVYGGGLASNGTDGILVAGS